jgi:hypothetical protein
VTLLLAAALPCLLWTQGLEGAPTVKAAGIRRVCVPPEQADGWRAAGFDVTPLADTDVASRERLPPPGIRPRGAGRVSATRSPWVNASGWRFRREPAGRYVYTLPPGTAALAAAEAFTYGGDAVLEVDPADLAALGQMTTFLSALPPNDLPDVAELSVVDDGTFLVGEVLNMLARRNLLYRVVKEPSQEFRVSVKVGAPEYPLAEAADPSAFALKIRRQLTDDERRLRMFGSEVVLGRLTADASRARLYLLNYSGRDQEGLRIRLRGTYPAGVALVPGSGPQPLQEFLAQDGGTEFTVPRLGPYAVVDLPAVE